MGNYGSQARLSKEDIEFIKLRTRFDEVTIKEWFQEFRKVSPSGKLKPMKFASMYSDFFPHGNANQFCYHVFRVFDIDHNGFVDFKEYMISIDVIVGGTAEEKVKWAFKLYDVDGNGIIDPAETFEVVKAILAIVSPSCKDARSRARKIFQIIDENEDGVLTQSEFVKCCLKNNEITRMLVPVEVM